MSTFNKDFLAELGMDEKVIESAETQTVREGFKPLDSGAYKATVKELATFVSSGGAKMMKVTVHIEKEDKDIEVYQNTIKKDGTPNEIGQATFKHILEAVAGEDKSGLSTKKEKLKAYGKEVEGTVVKGLAGKPFIALVRSIHEEGAKYDTYNEIEAYANAAGQNSKGEDLIETFKKKIAEKPVLERKAKDGSTGTTAATAGTTTATAESVADML